MRHIVLVGPMGVGKTTVGRELASRLGRPFVDSDVELEEVHGATSAEIASRDGVERLHALELETFLAMVKAKTPSVVSPAASVVDAEQGRAVLGRNMTVWLQAPKSVLAVRRRADDHRRQVDEKEVRELELRRRPHWADLAAIRINTSGPVSDVVDALESKVRRFEAG